MDLSATSMCRYENGLRGGVCKLLITMFCIIHLRSQGSLKAEAKIEVYKSLYI
jgi:hypothetical protein